MGNKIQIQWKEKLEKWFNSPEAERWDEEIWTAVKAAEPEESEWEQNSFSLFDLAIKLHICPLGTKLFIFMKSCRCLKAGNSSFSPFVHSSKSSSSSSSSLSFPVSPPQCFAPTNHFTPLFLSVLFHPHTYPCPHLLLLLALSLSTIKHLLSPLFHPGRYRAWALVPFPPSPPPTSSPLV